ncbi:MAG: hypothetical protein FWG73_00470 [Planctomycetaceae bacterium]|nr:hypothetical protein [Planctomycetaceae bacterium]
MATSIRGKNVLISIGKKTQDCSTLLGTYCSLWQRCDVEGHKIDQMEQIALQKVQMEAESKKMMLDLAMRFPVRGGLEESYNMINDEQIKQEEAQRLFMRANINVAQADMWRAINGLLGLTNEPEKTRLSRRTAFAFYRNY